MWEEFALSETVDVSRVSIVAVEGPEGADADYPTLRASDCKAVGYLNTSRSTWVRTCRRRCCCFVAFDFCCCCCCCYCCYSDMNSSP